MSDRCKNCGYCPHCGKSDRLPSWPYPYAPWGYPYGPYRYPNAYWSTGGTSIPANTINTAVSQSTNKF